MLEFVSIIAAEQCTHKLRKIWSELHEIKRKNKNNKEGVNFANHPGVNRAQVQCQTSVGIMLKRVFPQHERSKAGIISFDVVTFLGGARLKLRVKRKKEMLI